MIWAAVSLSMAMNSLAEVRLPKLIGDNMVLQRDTPLTLWGWADPGEQVQVRFRGRMVSATTNAKGRWTVQLAPQSAGGPDDLTLTGKNTVTIRNVLVGDVWLASGQSNMQFSLKEVDKAAREIDGARFPEIRLFAVNRESALKPKDDVSSEGGWQLATPDSASNFSAVAYLFARELYERHRVPLGLIEADYGGTPAEVWASESALKTIPEFQHSLECIARADEKSRSHYNKYLSQKEAWNQAHEKEDRGSVGGRSPWADPNFDVSKWPVISIPRPWFVMGRDFKGFGGTVWFRKDLDLPEEQAGHGIFLHLGKMVEADTTFFNGEKIGNTAGSDTARVYFVPGSLVRAGKNVIAIRLTGDTSSPGFRMVGMFGHLSSAPAKMYVDAGVQNISLYGAWSYQPGPDLSTLPDPPEYAAFAGPSRDAPTVLYNAMIAPLTSFRIRGVIWYQGESNEDRPTLYRTLFPALIRDWRAQWGYEFPFLFVQLAGFNHNDLDPGNYSWPELRDAQTVALSLPQTGMATAIDVGDEEDIHPKDKQDVAHRLVLVADKVAYGENVVDSGPTYQSMRVEGARIRIKFSNLGSGLLIKDKYGYPRGFEVAGSDGKVVWAQAQMEGSDIIVFHEGLDHPIAVRYDWSNTPDGNVFNQEGLPALPFCSDCAPH